jgi:hypothetical protein
LQFPLTKLLVTSYGVDVAPYMCLKDVKHPTGAPCLHKNADDEYIPTRYMQEEILPYFRA